jgi:iron(III) transport system ATP-binding protein
MSEVAIRAEQLSCPRLGPLSFTLPVGGWTRVVGPSGCGKTTLLRLLAGLIRPQAGELDLWGAPASRASRLLLPPERRAIGMVFQGSGAGLWPHLSAQATLEFVDSCRGVPRTKRAARAARLLERVQLSGKERRKPGELSGGEAARLALARALASEPRLLLLDEPLGALDSELRAGMIELLASLREEGGLTIVHVTHDPAELEGWAGKTLRLEQGRLIGEDRSG